MNVIITKNINKYLFIKKFNIKNFKVFRFFLNNKK